MVSYMHMVLNYQKLCQLLKLITTSQEGLKSGETKHFIPSPNFKNESYENTFR